jgi:hypothetical protein
MYSYWTGRAEAKKVNKHSNELQVLHGNTRHLTTKEIDGRFDKTRGGGTGAM